MLETLSGKKLSVLLVLFLVIIVFLGYFMVFGGPGFFLGRVDPEFDFRYPREIWDRQCEDITLSREQPIRETIRELVDSSIPELEGFTEFLFSENQVKGRVEKMKLLLRFVQIGIRGEAKGVDEGISLKCPVHTVLFQRGSSVEKVNLFASMAEAAGFDAVIILTYSEDGSKSRFFAGLVAEEKTLAELDQYFYFESKGNKYLVFQPNDTACDFSCHPGQLFVRGIGEDGHKLLLNEKTFVIEVGQ